jgi:hypothetical protein
MECTIYKRRRNISIKFTNKLQVFVDFLSAIKMSNVEIDSFTNTDAPKNYCYDLQKAV